MKFKPLSETKYVWIILLVLTLIAILFKSVYRFYIYSNQINDFGIADSSPNFFAGLIIVMTYYVQKQKISLKNHTFFSVVGLLGYEFIQGSIFKSNVFDFKDIIASILGVFVGYYICTFLNSISFSGFQNLIESEENL